jgi:diadenosine tetraphosphate (Ap4A) HIT family hydrolase
MIKTISRKRAIDEISNTLKQGECLVCNLLENANYILDKGKFTTVILSGYPRTWGHTMVLLNSHKTSISEISKEEWAELSEQARKSASIIEKTLKPLRCYVASLGATENLPNTCPHIHFNVIPVYNMDDKPSTIFTWEQGVLAGNEEEWRGLYNSLKVEW